MVADRSQESFSLSGGFDWRLLLLLYDGLRRLSKLDGCAAVKASHSEPLGLEGAVDHLDSESRLGEGAPRNLDLKLRLSVVAHEGHLGRVDGVIFHLRFCEVGERQVGVANADRLEDVVRVAAQVDAAQSESLLAGVAFSEAHLGVHGPLEGRNLETQLLHQSDHDFVDEGVDVRRLGRVRVLLQVHLEDLAARLETVLEDVGCGSDVAAGAHDQHQVGLLSMLEASVDVDRSQVLVEVDDRVVQLAATGRIIAQSARRVLVNRLGRSSSEVPHVVFLALFADLEVGVAMQLRQHLFADA